MLMRLDYKHGRRGMGLFLSTDLEVESNLSVYRHITVKRTVWKENNLYLMMIHTWVADDLYHRKRSLSGFHNPVHKNLHVGASPCYL
jgi:hypothetical protein